MTEVEFHTGVVDPIGFTCRLLRKAARQGVRVRVVAPSATLVALDRALWSFDERDFVPHVRVPGASASVAARTPIWLTPTLQAVVGDLAAPAVALNVGHHPMNDLSGLDRLIEVVGAEPEEANRGRSRWRAYKVFGLDITHHPAASTHG